MKFSELTEKDKKFLNTLLGFGYKLSLFLTAGYISANYSRIDLINYKKNTFLQIFTFMAIEDILNSYLPTWFKKEKEIKVSRSMKLFFSTPIDAEPGKTLNPAHHEL